MRTPDKANGAAKAWRSQYDAAGPADASYVVSWLLNGPWHPAWSYWYIGAVDLLERPGVNPAHRKYPAAEHEILILSLDPDHPPDPDVPGSLRFLEPADLVYQLDGLPREKVAEIVELMVEMIVNGGASPDSDHRSWWTDSLDTTVAHYKQGRH